MKKLLLGITLALAASVAAFAQQGAFPNYPIVGGAAYCSSTTNGSCTNTVPAGPSILTGNEQLPANTELPGGQSPQNVLITPKSLNALPITTFTATNAAVAAISASNISGGVLIISSGTLSIANISLPLAPINGQQYLITSNATLTALKVSVYPTSTATIADAPTVLTPSTTGSYGYKFMYHSADTKWYRLQ